jgi:hypothetical protein
MRKSTKLVLKVSLLTAVAAFIVNLPEVRRYLRARLS